MFTNDLYFLYTTDTSEEQYPLEYTHLLSSTKVFLTSHLNDLQAMVTETVYHLEY